MQIWVLIVGVFSSFVVFDVCVGFITTLLFKMWWAWLNFKQSLRQSCNHLVISFECSILFKWRLHQSWKFVNFIFVVSQIHIYLLIFACMYVYMYMLVCREIHVFKCIQMCRLTHMCRYMFKYVSMSKCWFTRS